MIGDTPYNVEAALRAGIAIVGVESGGWGPDNMRGAVEVHPGAAEICAHYDQLRVRAVETRRPAHSLRPRTARPEP